MTISFDSPDLQLMANDLIAAERNITNELTPVVARGALNIKTDARKLLSAKLATKSHLKWLPAAITYDEVQSVGGEVFTEIGPETDLLQGGFGRGAELGSSNTPPIPHLFPAADTEEPKFAEQVADAAVRMLT